ncbi:MAG: SGNH/GDSL hydrolase family protein [Candidatus Marinimicrobia bacterium]|nr:SGNH/GDSL hydrolase family protein [Candidatus Neomarinimicrobiota bacterium]
MKNSLFTISLMFSFILMFTLCSRNPLKIVAFGDSITAGTYLNGKSWVYHLDKQNDKITVVNAGRNGRKTSDKHELIPVIQNNKDTDIFMIFLGVNDLKDGNDSLVENCVNNVSWMIDMLKQSIPDVKIYLLSPCDINLETMSELNKQKKYNQNTKNSLYKLNKEYEKLAKRKKVEFISLLKSVSTQNYTDGLHPDSNGQTEIANTIWERLKCCVK